MLSGLFGSKDANKTILQTLESYPSTWYLRKALQDEQFKDICELLAEPTAKTFFCPTNDALTELTQGSKGFGAPLECYMRDILNCHIILDKAVSSKSAPCLLENNCKNGQWVNKDGKGQTMQLCKDECGLFVNFGIPGWSMWQARVWQADIPCSNGTLFIVSKVMRFPYSASSMMKLQGSGISFRYALEDYGLNTLSNCLPSISVFVPKSESVDSVVAKNLGPEIMRDTLMSHHVKGCFFSSDLKDGQSLKSFNGHDLKVSVDSKGCVSVNGVKVLEADIITKNGVVHIIDGVLPDKYSEEVSTVCDIDEERKEELGCDISDLSLSTPL